MTPLPASPPGATTEPPVVSTGTLARWSLLLLAALVAWDLSGADLPIAGWLGGAEGFPLRSHWLLSDVLHDGGRLAGWAAVLALCLGVWWPFGPLRRIGIDRRLQLAAGTLGAVMAVAALKGVRLAACPADLSLYGRSAQYLSNWSWPPAPQGGGHCFPAAHSAAGFAFVNGYFAFRHDAPALARRWLVAALAVGLVLGVAQQARGQHLTGHTLWTAWLCWCLALVADRLHDRLHRADPGVPA